MPKRDGRISNTAKKKFDAMNMTQDPSFYNLNLFCWKPLVAPDGEVGQPGITAIEYQRVLNVQVSSDASTRFKVPLVPNDRIGTADGVIKAKLFGAGKKPLESQMKGNNTLSWLESIETIEVEINGQYSVSNLLDLFTLSDIRENIITVGGEKRTLTKVFYISSVAPIVDHLSLTKTVVGERLTLTAGISSLLQDEDTGGTLFIDYLVEPVKPADAAYAEITYKSYMFHQSLTGKDGSGNPLSIERVDKFDDEAPDNLGVSDVMLLDGVYPKTVVGSSTKWSSWMSGELYNKIRIWDTLFIGLGSVGDFDRGEIKKVLSDGSVEFDNGGREKWDKLIPGEDYVYLLEPGLSLQFHEDVKHAFGGGYDPVPPWYNDFSFFTNLYTERPISADWNTGNPKWKTNNSYFVFDVQFAQFGAIQPQESIVVQRAIGALKNPNLSEQDYEKMINDASLGSVIINGVTFNAWDNPIAQIDKSGEALYDWIENTTDKKYIVLTPGSDEKARMNKIISAGGKETPDNSYNIKIGNAQTTSARHPFPTGEGSMTFTYPQEIFFSSTYCEQNGWETNNKILFRLNNGVDGVVNSFTGGSWGGEEITIKYFNSKGEPSSGLDQDGEPIILPPTTIPAANQDSSGNVFKSIWTVVFGFTTT